MIYLDNAATTKMWPQAVEAMLPYFTESYGNSSAIYGLAGEAKAAIRASKKKIADALGASAECIYFTSGGSESDNWAIKSVAEAYSQKGHHIITSKIEHHAVLNSCKYLERQGYEVTYLGVDSNGMISIEELRRAIRKDTILISVMMANNEIGTIEPISEIGRVAHENGIIFHTDAVQAVGHMPIDVSQLNIDMLSASAHKFGGPKGIGFLYLDKRVRIGSFIHGGSQERGLRAGTMNVPAIVGMAKALELSIECMEDTNTRLLELRNYLVKEITTKIPFSQLNGSLGDRLASNTNFSFKHIDAQTLVVMLDIKGICASTGAACNESIDSPSHVLRAIGLSDDEVKGSLRLSLGPDTTLEEIDLAIEIIEEQVRLLRMDQNILVD